MKSRTCRDATRRVTTDHWPSGADPGDVVARAATIEAAAANAGADEGEGEVGAPTAVAAAAVVGRAQETT